MLKIAVRVLNEQPIDAFEEKMCSSKGKKEKKSKTGSKVSKGAIIDAGLVNAEAIEGARVLKWCLILSRFYFYFLRFHVFLLSKVEISFSFSTSREGSRSS